MGIDVSMIDDAINISTAGGMSRVFVEPAEAAFVDAEAATRYVYRVMLTIAEPLRSTEFVPSLLGRDIINRWRIDYHPTSSQLHCEVITADVVIELPAS